VTDGGLVAARAIAYLALLLTAGLPLYLISAGRGIALPQCLRAAEMVLALAGAAASAWWALASVAAMAALPIGGLDIATVNAVLAATPLGMVLAIRLAALALVLLVAVMRPRPGLMAIPAAVALATCAWAGHAGATEGALGHLHRLADIIHLLAAATWLGALVMLLGCVMGSTPPDELGRRLAGFAATGSAVVVLLVATGIANTLFIAGWPLPLGSAWTLMLAVKIVLFAGMLGLAALNRWRLTPALADQSDQARRRLRRSLAIEMALGLGVVAAVGVLGVLDPAA